MTNWHFQTRLIAVFFGALAFTALHHATAANPEHVERFRNTRECPGCDLSMPGDGRVYHISFTGTDAQGGSCTGTVQVGIPHDQGGSSTPIDGGPLYDSLIAVPKK